jgi:hypothetical protein
MKKLYNTWLIWGSIHFFFWRKWYTHTKVIEISKKKNIYISLFIVQTYGKMITLFISVVCRNVLPSEKDEGKHRQKWTKRTTSVISSGKLSPELQKRKKSKNSTYLQVDSSPYLPPTKYLGCTVRNLIFWQSPLVTDYRV